MKVKVCKCGHGDYEHIGSEKNGPCSHLLLVSERHRFCDCMKFEEEVTKLDMDEAHLKAVKVFREAMQARIEEYISEFEREDVDIDGDYDQPILMYDFGLYLQVASGHHPE